MTIVRTGVDLVEIERIRSAMQRHGERFLHRVFTPKEIKSTASRVESLAVRFAAKEAVAKALGCGIGEISWHEIEVSQDDNNAPMVTLHGRAQEIAHTMGLKIWAVSLSHSNDMAIASVVAIG